MTGQDRSRDRPLMGMVIVAYRHEKYIRDALQAAFAQTWSPLEIVISDDASSDATWRIISEEAARYGGPHRLILNRNEKNLSVILHVAHASSLTRAEHVVIAAGDDISEPDRVARVAEAFMADPQLKFATSTVTVIDEDGRKTGLTRSWPGVGELTIEGLTDVDTGYVLGCAGAYSQEVFDRFPGFLPSVALEEDHILPFRAALLGNIACIEEPLVRYRRHWGNVTARWIDIKSPVATVLASKSQAAALEQKLTDIAHLRTQRPELSSWLDGLAAACARSRALALARIEWETRGMAGLRALLRGFRNGDLDMAALLKTALRVNAPKLWYRYAGWRRRRLEKSAGKPSGNA